MKVLVWPGDVGQTASGAALFTSTKTGNERGDMVKRFMIAYRQGMRDFHDAFAGPDNQRRDGPLAPVILPIMADFTHTTPEDFYRAIPFADPDGQIDPAGIERQIVWYRAQNLLKVDVNADDIIDKRYAILTPPQQAATGATNRNGKMTTDARRIALAAAITLLSVSGAHAEAIKVGISKLIGFPGVPIAIARGYFKAQDIDAQMVIFDSAQPIAVAVASGDIDFGTGGMSASFYTFAAQGQLKLIASSGGNAPGYYNLAFVASNKAWDAGLKTVADIKGHSVAITQIGTALHYSVGEAARHYGFTMSDITLKPLQSNSNVLAALSGGTVDAAVMPGAPILGPIQRGDFHLLEWAGDVAPIPTGNATFTATRTANERGDLVKRFLVAYRHGTRDFAAAFVTPNGPRHDGPDAPAILDIMANFIGVAPTEIAKAIPYVDGEGRIDAASIADQIAWYKAQNLMKADVSANDIIDTRYAILLPHR